MEHCGQEMKVEYFEYEGTKYVCEICGESFWDSYE